jgi:hypothetical protein
MKTKPNYKGESFEVTFDKEFEIRHKYTFKFILKREEDIDSRMMDVFATDIRKQIANVGCAVFFSNLPREDGELAFIPYQSNGNLIEEVYRMIENGECA